MPIDPIGSDPIGSIAELLHNTPAFAALSIEARERIAQRTSERTLAANEFLIREGDPAEALYIVLSGALHISQKSLFPQTLPEALQPGTAVPGQIVGELTLLTGHPSPVTVDAAEPTVIRTLASADLDLLCVQFPEEMATTVAWMATRLDHHQILTAIEANAQLRSLTREAKHDLAAALEPVNVTAGQALYREGQQGDALYLILSGRMRLQSESLAGILAKPLADLGKGDLFGELSLLTRQPRSDSAIAVRDSHLARLSTTAFNTLVASYPAEILGLFSRQLAERLRDQNVGREQEGRPPVAIAVLPLTPNEQAGGARDFAAELVRQLSAFGPTLHLNRTVIDRVFPQQRGQSARISGDSNALQSVTERRLVAWVEDLEMIYRHVVYEADYQTGITESAWTSRCLRQADVLLVIAGGPADPRNSEKTMVRLTQKALPSVKTTLVLTHPEGPTSVRFTKSWKQSMGIDAHEHIRRSAAGQMHPGDVGRIARALNRQSVGLVLSGGFALGLAHIGVIDAMRELDIPIDFVGGTSMGAIIAAAAAQEFSHDQMLEVMDKGCAQALKGDYTLPIVSLLTGKKVTAALGKYLETLDIEDLWLPYFAISASLVHARMIVHTTGSALKSVLASCRAPGMFPPLEWDGDVLVDGGLVNNVPADVMRAQIGAGTVFAIDVSPQREFTDGLAFGPDYTHAVSGWKVARQNFSPARKGPKLGTLADVLMRLIRLGGVAHHAQIQASADLYLSIPLDTFKIRDFHRGEEMAQAGYQYAKQQLQLWISQHGRPWQGTATQT
jgi:predicted acylesterase/phospholipase RssA/CRP-like cAMP-binding protein